MLISQLSAHLEKSDINITLTKNGDVITAIVLPKPKNDKLSNLSPIVAKGTAEELDKHLAAALQSTFDTINSFKVENTEIVESEVKEASQPQKQAKVKPEPKSEIKEDKPVKVNPKIMFDDASKLFKEGKYAEALPLYQSAADLKPESKQYSEALKLCAKWVDSLKKADMFLDSNKSEEIERGVEIIKISEESINSLPEVEEAQLDAEAETFEEEEFKEEVDEDDFPL
jgi:PRTRC genetic system protein E